MLADDILNQISARDKGVKERFNAKQGFDSSDTAFLDAVKDRSDLLIFVTFLRQEIEARNSVIAGLRAHIDEQSAVQPVVSKITKQQLRMQFEQVQANDNVDADDLRYNHAAEFYHHEIVNAIWVGWMEHARHCGMLVGE